jgi:flagellar motor protein MotB
MKYSNGDIYEGEWKDDRWHGEGMLQQKGMTYRGEFRKGQKHGQGKEYYNGKDTKPHGTYEGYWYEGNRHGCGFMAYPPGGGHSVREYEHGKLIESKPLSDSNAGDRELAQKMAEWEEQKEQRVAELQRTLEAMKKAEEEKLAKQNKEWEAEKAREKAEWEQERATIRKEKDALEQQKLLFEEQKNQVADLNAKALGIVKINAGGKEFTTSISTVTKYNGLLKTMFSGQFQLERLSDGSVFIDVDPTIFGYILSFLRDPVFFPPESAQEKKKLLEVAKIYGMQELIDYLKSSSS